MMGIKTKEITECTCDVCGKVCEVFESEFCVTINSGDGRDVGPSEIFGKVYVNNPYGYSKGIVCKECKIKWLKIYLERLC
jgi:hypothetical protein